MFVADFWKPGPLFDKVRVLDVAREDGVTGNVSKRHSIRGAGSMLHSLSAPVHERPLQHPIRLMMCCFS